MTTQFEIGKKYASQYNSGVITIIKRTTKFVTFTEEINGQSMKSMIINGNGEISQGKAIETRKSIKVLNDSEYLSNGICSYYATSEIVEEPIETEEVVSDDQKDNGVIQFENGKKYGTEDGYVGDSVNYCHSLSDEWKSFVQEYMITCVNSNISFTDYGLEYNGYLYDSGFNRIYVDALHNGIKSNLEDERLTKCLYYDGKNNSLVIESYLEESEAIGLNCTVQELKEAKEMETDEYSYSKILRGQIYSEIKKELQPNVIKLDKEIKFTALSPSINKTNNIDELNEEILRKFSYITVTTDVIVELSEVDFNWFINGFMEYYKWFSSSSLPCGGNALTEYGFIVTNGKQIVIVNHEGYSYARYVYIAKDEKELLDTISPYLLPNDAVMLSPKMTALNDSVMLSPSNLSSQIKELRQQLKADLECLMSSELTNKKARKDSLIKDYETEINELIIKSRKQVI
jgi:hypothetical protein